MRSWIPYLVRLSPYCHKVGRSLCSLQIGDVCPLTVLDLQDLPLLLRATLWRDPYAISGRDWVGWGDVGVLFEIGCNLLVNTFVFVSLFFPP